MILFKSNTAKPGDTIVNNQTQQTWTAEMCPHCKGIGVVSLTYVVIIRCPMCVGNKVIWKVTKVTSNPNNNQVE